MHRFIKRMNFDTHEEEASIAGVWVPLRIVGEGNFVYGDVKTEEAIIEKYGQAVLDAIYNTPCKHYYVFQGIQDGDMLFKCHDCGSSKLGGAYGKEI